MFDVTQYNAKDAVYMEQNHTDIKGIIAVKPFICWLPPFGWDIFICR
jgi:hypothetical protein